jgi:hypothetical protein
MLSTPNRKYRRRRGRALSNSSGSNPRLVIGTFSPVSGLSLGFDHEVTTDLFNGSQLVVTDPASGASYQGTGTPSVSGSTVQVSTMPTGSASGSQTTLNAGAGTGVMAAATNTPWTGVSGFALTSASGDVREAA